MYKLGFDLDEVLVKTLDRVREYLTNEFGFDIEPETITDFRFYKHPLYEENQEAFESLFEKFKDMSFFESCKPDKTGVKTLKQLQRKGHTLYFISNRPKGREEETAKWFRKYKIPFNKIFHTNFDTDKGFVGRHLNLDFYVDDRVEDIESMLKYKNRWKKGIFIFDKPWNRHYHNNRVGRLYDWQEVMHIVNNPKINKINKNSKKGV